jgi:hypothetical protein
MAKGEGKENKALGRLVVVEGTPDFCEERTGSVSPLLTDSPPARSAEHGRAYFQFITTP